MIIEKLIKHAYINGDHTNIDIYQPKKRHYMMHVVFINLFSSPDFL